jgi:hypothetical protein
MVLPAASITLGKHWVKSSIFTLADCAINPGNRVTALPSAFGSAQGFGRYPALLPSRGLVCTISGLGMTRHLAFGWLWLVAVSLAITVLFLIPTASSAAQQNEWRDPSPHVVKFVEVDTDVRLEVLDWGGSGPALVLLAGGGATVHQYDDLAPALAARYRVVGVTRRGHGGSSAAP